MTSRSRVPSPGRILAVLLLAAGAAVAAPTDLDRSLLFAAQQEQDPELSAAVQTLIDKGFVPRIRELLALDGVTLTAGVNEAPAIKMPAPAGVDLKRLREQARTYLARKYRGLPISGGRVFRRAKDPAHVWCVEFSVEGWSRRIEIDTRDSSLRESGSKAPRSKSKKLGHGRLGRRKVLGID